MTSRDFCYWLQGYFEIRAERNGELQNLNEAQTECVKKHLALVFKHEIDPSAGSPEHQAELNKLHDAMVKMQEQITSQSFKDIPIRC